MRKIDDPVTAGATGSQSRITIGGVTVVVSEPSATEVQRNVDESTHALERAMRRIIKPGVRLYRRKGVPLYSADPERPGVFIRKLDGRTERGTVENGGFKVID